MFGWILGGIAALATIAVVSSNSSSQPSTGLPPVGQGDGNPFPTGDGVDPTTGLPPGVIDCDTELSKLPPALQTMLTSAASGGDAAVGKAADAIEAAGYPAQAACVREMTKQSAATSGPPSAATCDAYLNDLPEPARTAVKDILAKGDPTAIITTATTLDAQGYHEAAQCVRDVASKGILPGQVPESALPGMGLPGIGGTPGVPGVPDLSGVGGFFPPGG